MQSETNAAAIKADRDRIAAIAALPDARGREALAMNLATTGISVDQARAALAAAPIDAAVASSMWDAALTSRGMKVGASAPPASPWDEVLRAKGMVGA
jgi:hypothetical protein